jgi:pyridoxal phosphate enzyme (YggS family)
VSARADIPRRLAEVRDRLGAAAARAGRGADAVRLVAVSKTHPIEAVRAAYESGQRDFGENRVQEALQKMASGADMQIRWHLIGHLQSNKAKKAVGAAYIHTIDSVDLLQKVDQAAAALGRSVDVLVQVDLALEPTKFGAPEADVPAIVQAASACAAARLVGLMLLPPIVDDPEQARPWFRRLRALRDQLVEAGAPAAALRELSMGMSHDFEAAIAEGSTMVRVGTAIFGSRS